MLKRNKFLIGLAVLIFVFSFSAVEINAKTDETKHNCQTSKNQIQSQKSKNPVYVAGAFRRQSRATGGREKFQCHAL